MGIERSYISCCLDFRNSFSRFKDFLNRLAQEIEGNDQEREPLLPRTVWDLKDKN